MNIILSRWALFIGILFCSIGYIFAFFDVTDHSIDRLKSLLLYLIPGFILIYVIFWYSNKKLKPFVILTTYIGTLFFLFFIIMKSNIFSIFE
ncbi:MAG: hypothetical protein KAT05_03910 [Spirochaetes bacterium]|nr:hypothetical protein [Spirochaetota bacterium]